MSWSVWPWRNKVFRAEDRDSPLYHGADSYAGETVTTHGAMQLSAFWACVRLIAQTVATLPLGVFERQPDGQKIARPDHPLYRLLHDSPNADQTAVEFWEGRVLGLCTAGNGYAEKILGNGGRLVSLEPMPADTHLQRLETGELKYTFFQYGKQRELMEDRVFHIRGFGDGDKGLAPVTFARQTLGIAQATERATGNFFAKGMRAKGFFTFPQVLKQEQRDQIHKNLIAPFAGPGAKDWGLLEAGVDVKTVSISARDAELIMSRRFNVEDICRWHGMMPILIGHASEGQTMWGTGVTQIVLAWYTLGLRPILERIEQSITKRLIEPGERGKIFAEFNIEGLLRGDAGARAEFYSKMIQNAGMKPNEARAKENLPPDKGGDRLFINSTLVPLDMAGKLQPQPPPATKSADDGPLVVGKQRMKIVNVTKRDELGRIAETVTREIEEA